MPWTRHIRESKAIGKWTVTSALMTFVTAGAVIAAAAQQPAGEHGIAPLRATLLGVDGATGGHATGLGVLVVAGTETLLFDCGRVVPARLDRLGIRVSDVTALFLTHLDRDDTHGVRDLHLTDSSGWRGARPFQIWGPVGTREMIRRLQQDDMDRNAPGVDSDSPSEIVGFTVTDLAPGVVSEPNGVKVISFYGDRERSSFGYRVDFNGHSIVIGVEITDPPVSAKGVDLLILRRVDPNDAGRILAETRPRLAVVSSRGAVNPVPHVKQSYAGSVELAEDMTAIDVGEHVQVRHPAR
jgi:hypothetical protein